MPDDDDQLIKLLKNFIDNKAQLIDILKEENKSIKLNKNSTYKDIIAAVGKQRILDLLELQSIDEGFRKINVRGLLSNLNRNQVRVLAKELNFSGKTKTECLNAIWKIKETEILEAIKNLYNSNKISGVFQYNNIVFGPLGILDSHYEREYEYGDVINILNNFGQTDLRKIGESLKIGNDDDTKDHVIQKILTDFDNETVILAIQQLISEKQIQMPEISKWSKLVITPCGIFERKNIYGLRSKEQLQNFLLKEVPKDELVSVISHELKINSDNATAEMDRLLLEYCIDNPPEEVMGKFFSYPALLKLAGKIFHQRPPNSVPENEIISSILSILGFNNPPKLVGLKKYQEILKYNSDKIDVTVHEVITIANETDNILRNLIEFYSKFLWDIKMHEDFKKIISDNFEIKKHFSKLSSGELVGILRNLNELIHKDKTMADKMIHNFNRDCLIQNKTLKILDSWVSYRNAMAHGNTTTKNIDENRQALKKLIDFSNDIQENVYPLLVRMDREETDKYGTHFVILKDEWDNLHRIYRSVYIDTIVLYFMSRSNKTLRINPFIVKRET